MKRCAICGRPITEYQMIDETGTAHLQCAIEISSGCSPLPGVFIHCAECWESCPYRCELPTEENE